MARVPIEVDEYIRFVRKNEEFFYGPNHVTIVKEMGWTGSVEEIIEKLRKEGGVDLDMGLIGRWEFHVGVGQISSTFNYPGRQILDMVRTRTMEILPKVYDEDVFRRLGT